MKKILLILAILPIFAKAQIGPIKTQDKPGEFIWNCVYHDKPSDTYYLHAQSDNQFEDKVMRIKIGDNATEAAQSLANLLVAFNDAGKQFSLGTCTFIVANTGTFLRVLNRGQLEYTAGNYYIEKQHVIDAIWFIVNHRNGDIGVVSLYVTNVYAGKMAVKFQSYGIDGVLNFKKNIKPYLSRNYASGEIVSDEDVCRLSDAIEAGKLLRSHIITSMCAQTRNIEEPLPNNIDYINVEE